MKGITKLTLNQETMIAALQKYFITDVFDASQLAAVLNIEPKSEWNDGRDVWSYVVTIDSTVHQVLVAVDPKESA